METAVDLMVQSVLRFVAVAEVCAGSRKQSFAGMASAPGTQHFAQQREHLCAGAVLYSAEPADRSCDRRTRSRRSATDRKSTRLNSSHVSESRMPSSA